MVSIWALFGCKGKEELAAILPKTLEELEVHLCDSSTAEQVPAHIKEEPAAVFHLFENLPYLNLVDIIRSDVDEEQYRRMSFKRRTPTSLNGTRQKTVSYHRLELAHPNPGGVYENHLKCVENLEYPINPKWKLMGLDAPNYGNILREYEEDIESCTADGLGGCRYLLADEWDCKPSHFSSS
ncbi:hypothetical protein TWF718_009761 [Orbilia javanica]|uniref:Uncharacterized protein n=1 Tax=Orbilia javanica TaxID=47235 RepID=A0AAN8RLN3_9PEZI